MLGPVARGPWSEFGDDLFEGDRSAAQDSQGVFRIEIANALFMFRDGY